VITFDDVMSGKILCYVK